MARDVLLPRRVGPGGEVARELGTFLAESPTPWFVDVESADRVVLLRLEGDPVTSVDTGLQRLDLLDTARYGRCLVLDGRFQLAEADEFVYHELLVHPAAVLARERRSALVLGGGDGCTLRELTRWRSLERVDLVELDPEVVRITREHCPHWSAGAYDDPRVTLHVADAVRFLEPGGRSWDLVVADLTEPFDETGQAGDLSAGFFGRRVLDLVRERLAPGGIFVAQTGGLQLVPGLDRHHRRLVDAIRAVFPWTEVAAEYVPSFGELWTVTLAAGEPPLPREVDRELEKGGVEGLRFYDAETHGRVLRAPRFLRDTRVPRGVPR